MEKSVNHDSVYNEDLWIALEELSSRSFEEKFISPINTCVEKLKEVFINRGFYTDDNEWLSDVAGLVFDLFEETNNEEHWMYPKKEFQESYVTNSTN